jgi:hypothetical protein
MMWGYRVAEDEGATGNTAEHEHGDGSGDEAS